MAAVALQDALPHSKPSSRPGVLERQASKSSCTLPSLTRQTSRVTAVHGVSGRPWQYARTASMFVLPDRGAGGALQCTGSSTLQGVDSRCSSSPREQHPEPAAACGAQALALGDEEPLVPPANVCGDSGASSPAAATTTLETRKEEETEPAGAGLTARCRAAAGTWGSLQDFSALRVVAQGGRSTVWEALPKAPGQRELPGGCWHGLCSGRWWPNGRMASSPCLRHHVP